MLEERIALANQMRKEQLINFLGNDIYKSLDSKNKSND